MFTALNRYLMVFLAILQLIAPLVHAHTSAEFPDAGLHVPGLEIFSTQSNDLDAAALLESPIDAGLVIGLDAGIEHQATDLSGEFQQFAILADFAVPESRELSFFINFSPQLQNQLCFVDVLSIHSPRAPPFFI